MKIGIIGTGNMGKKHIRVFSELEKVKHIVVADVNTKDEKYLKKRFGVSFYTDYKEMLEKEKPDAVTICVPTSLHYQVAVWCIKNKINIFIEKPIAANVSDATKLLKLAEKHKIFLMVGHIERFNPAVRKVKEMIDEGQLGDVIAIIARRLGGFPPQITDVNIGVDLAIHDIDICNMILNEVPKQVSVNSQRNHIKRREDSVEFFLKYKKASAYIQANWVSPVKIRMLTITGTEGYLEMNYITQKIEFFKSKYEKFKNNIGDFSDFVLRFSNPDRIVISINEREPLKEELSYFIESLDSKKRVSSKYALDALKIASLSK